MSPKLPTSIFAEWVERGYTEWLDRVNPLPNTPTIDLTEDEVKPSTIEIEIGLLARVFGLPMEAQELISKGVFWGDFKRSRILNMDPFAETWEIVEDKYRSWGRISNTGMSFLWFMEFERARKHSLENACKLDRCGGSRFSDHSNNLTYLATEHFGKGNSKVKQDFQKYLGAIRMVCKNDARFYTGSPTKDHPTKPFKKLTCSSFDC
tara:strand:+ start:496 stop:1116 length:621 start_codon:yes stop_codon:yes gene_type:complete